MKTLLTVLFLILLWRMTASAQEQKNENRFHAGLSLGINVPHMFTSTRAEYGPGPNAGVYTSLRLGRKLAMRMEVRYSQNPGHIRIIEYPGQQRVRGRFNYAEVPLVLQFIPKQSRKGPELSFVAGAAYAHLVNYQVRASNGDDLTDEVVLDGRYAVVPLAGVRFHKNHFGGEVRFSRPLELNVGFTMLACFNYEI